MRLRIVKDFVGVDMDDTINNSAIGTPVVQAAVFILILVLSTHCFTTARYLFQSFSDRRYKGKEPTSLPYQLPGVGSALQLVRNPHGFFDSVVRRVRDGEPIRIRLGNLHAYLISGSKNVQHIFRCSRDLTFEEFALRVAHNVKGLPDADTALVAKDLSGSSTVSLTETNEEDRIWRKFHELYETHLIGSNAVACLTDLFIGNVVEQFNHIRGRGWVECGVDDFMKDKMFRASTVALAGPGVFDIDPEFAETFWAYDKDFMSLLYGLPRFLCRSGWQARDRCLETVRRYLEKGWQNIDWSATQDHNPNWEPNFGSKLVREREVAMDKYGITLQGRASFQMGLIWSINSNAIPMTSWIIIEILRRPEIHQRIKAEVSTIINHALLQSTDTTDPSSFSSVIDIPALKQLPLLNSIYLECLRLRSSVFVVRKLRNAVELDGYTLRAGNLILAPSYLAHKDETVWSTPLHPAEELWPERFMQQQKQQPGGGVDGKVGGPPNLHAGKFFPYGGGSAMCPGRNFAKLEILAAVALFFGSFEVEPLHFVDARGRYSDRGPEVGKEARGVARVDRDLKVRLRRIVKV
ncbi:related to cytochrome P450 7B1 [Cephalotrichum gorgonifer]|uniref:Related to cytochrome P450 7B1 n=1 Tax=Cephalotrichum gorgonifer TaxID=2041049 RepID=A0AAE8MXY7_9PEZI|nr:related to cytochrome P450 7B1 [Cephalotrichum gorgonifer]